MSQPVVIDFDNIASHFELSGDLNSMLANARLVASLKRLKFERLDEKLLIPFEEKTKIKILQELQMLLNKFSLDSILSDKTRSEVVSYDREQASFQDFSEKARDIRNNRFEDKPELVENFDEFQKVLKQKLVRPLYPLQLLSAFHMAFAQNACNFAVPGSGKTSIVYGAYTYLKNLTNDDPKRVDKILVIGPLSSFAPWEKEYKACFGRDVESQRLSGDNTILRAHKEQHLYSGNLWARNIFNPTKRFLTWIIYQKSGVLKSCHASEGVEINGQN